MTEFSLLVAAADGKLPEWIRLLPLGEVKLSDGREPFVVDAGSINQIVSAFRTRGIDLVIDYEHQSLLGERAPAAGWIKELQSRSDGLWGRVDWTKQGSEYLKNKEYRYFSPVLRLNPETRKPTALLHVGLTNVPAINHLPPLVAKAEAFADARAAQEARARQYGIGIKEGGNVTKPGGFASVPDEQWADPVNYRYHLEDRTHCQNALARWGDESNQAQYSPAERGIIEKRIRARAKEVGMQTQEEKPMKAELKKLLGITGEPADEEILALADTRIKLARALPEIATALGLAKDAEVAKIKGTILALKQGNEQLAILQTEVAALKAENAQTRAQGAVDEARAAKKITPAQTAWALRYAADHPEGFAAYVKAAPPVLDTTVLKIKTRDGKGEVALTPDELTMCKFTGVTPEAFAASKESLAQGQA